MLPGEAQTFDRTYSVTGNESDPFVNTAVAIGKPLHPDGYYLDNAVDVDQWAAEVYHDAGGLLWGDVALSNALDLTQLVNTPTSNEGEGTPVCQPMSETIARLIYGDAMEITL